eukprot:TRINITY_DN217_c1_g1_i1.p1 TRINITY_DN217_c1_g1~~TRINITY_DN217_c1_g1_i1.p1  ORF type:complete len:1789 (+),score=606.36 TRINITY_DN217_c1_g1_i1:64-5367(+)
MAGVGGASQCQAWIDLYAPLLSPVARAKLNALIKKKTLSKVCDELCSQLFELTGKADNACPTCALPIGSNVSLCAHTVTGSSKMALVSCFEAYVTSNGDVQLAANALFEMMPFPEDPAPAPAPTPAPAAAPAPALVVAAPVVHPPVVAPEPPKPAKPVPEPLKAPGSMTAAVLEVMQRGLSGTTPATAATIASAAMFQTNDDVDMESFEDEDEDEDEDDGFEGYSSEDDPVMAFDYARGYGHVPRKRREAVILTEWAKVRRSREMKSEEITSLQRGSLVVYDTKDRKRIRLVEPVVGWISLENQSQDRIVKKLTRFTGKTTNGLGRKDIVKSTGSAWKYGSIVCVINPTEVFIAYPTTAGMQHTIAKSDAVERVREKWNVADTVRASSGTYAGKVGFVVRVPRVQYQTASYYGASHHYTTRHGDLSPGTVARVYFNEVAVDYKPGVLEAVDFEESGYEKLVVKSDAKLRELKQAALITNDDYGRYRNIETVVAFTITPQFSVKCYCKNQHGSYQMETLNSVFFVSIPDYLNKKAAMLQPAYVSGEEHPAQPAAVYPRGYPLAMISKSSPSEKTKGKAKPAPKKQVAKKAAKPPAKKQVAKRGKKPAAKQSKQSGRKRKADSSEEEDSDDEDEDEDDDTDEDEDEDDDEEEEEEEESDEDSEGFPKLLCRLRLDRLSPAICTQLQKREGLELLDYGLTHEPETFLRFAPLTGLLSLDMIDLTCSEYLGYDEGTKKRTKKDAERDISVECVSTPFDYLEGMSISRLCLTYGVPFESSYGFNDSVAGSYLSDGDPMTLRMLQNKPPLAERVWITRHKSPNVEKVREAFTTQKSELMKFLINQKKGLLGFAPKSPLVINIFARQNLFTPSRFYTSANVPGRHLMTLILGCKYSQVGQSAIAPLPVAIGSHKWTPYLKDVVPKTAREASTLPCTVCSLPQVAHKECPHYELSHTPTCMLCGKGEVAHNVQPTRNRVQYTMHHEKMHKFVSRKGGKLLGKSTQEPCLGCNTPHADGNSLAMWREDLLLWINKRSESLFRSLYDESPKDTVHRHIDASMCLAVHDVSSGYTGEASDYGLRCEPRVYQRHAIDWMVKREADPTKALVRFLPVHFGDHTEGKYYYSDAYGEYSEGPFSVHGGILASEMGMGKTIMSLSCAMVNGPRASHDPSYPNPNGKGRKKKKQVEREPAKRGTMLMGGTLILTKATLWTQWSNEVRKKVGDDKVYVLDYYSGLTSAKRQALHRVMHQADFVVTNYDMLRVQKGDEPDSLSPMLDIWWHRVIFDEVHLVENTQTQQSKLAGNLRATHRWLLSGTPVQTNTANIIGLARALFGAKTSVSDVTQKNLCKWLEQYAIRHKVTQNFTDGTSYLDLPPKVELTHEIQFNDREKKIYNHAKTKIGEELRSENLSSSWWSTWNLGSSKLRRLASHFTNEHEPFTTGLMVHRLAAAGGTAGGSGAGWESRQATNTNNDSMPTKDLAVVLQSLGRFPEGQRQNIRESLEKSPAEFECPICYEQADDSFALTNCGHVFCPGCILPIAGAKDVCPICRTRMHSGEDYVTLVRAAVEVAPATPLPATPVQNSAQPAVEPGQDPGPDAPMIDQFRYQRLQSSSKITAMLGRITQVRTEDPQAKFIVFTQFESTIHAIESALTGAGHQHRKISGTMTQAQRSRVLAEFSENEECIVFILTVRSGACGLNLTSANHVFLMEPCLNPAQELQAIGRCHRITQTKTVYAHRFIMKGTIEEALHDAKGGGGGGKTSIMTPALIGKYFGIRPR